MSITGIFVHTGSVRLALDLKQHGVFWVAVGRTTPWPNENIPPALDITTANISEIQGYKKCEVFSLCKVDSEGSIIFNNIKYSLVSDVNAYHETARCMYFKASLIYDQFPLVTYRQVGLYVDTVPKAGFEMNTVLLPNQVDSPGKLLRYMNIPPVVRSINSKNIIEIVVEMIGVQ